MKLFDHYEGGGAGTASLNNTLASSSSTSNVVVSSFNSDICRWDISSVNSNIHMFTFARSFNKEFVSEWDFKFK